MRESPMAVAAPLTILRLVSWPCVGSLEEEEGELHNEGRDLSAAKEGEEKEEEEEGRKEWQGSINRKRAANTVLMLLFTFYLIF